MRRWASPSVSLSRGFALAVLFGAGAVLGQPGIPKSDQGTIGDNVGSKVLLLVRGDGDEELIRELRIELRRSSFRILELGLDARFTHREPLGGLGREYLASAVVRIALTESQIELWIHHPEGDVLDSLAVPGEAFDPRIDALRIAEALRAHGLDLGPRAGQAEPQEVPAVVSRSPPRAATPQLVSKRPPKQPAAPPPPAAAQSNGRFWVGVGAGMAASPGGLPPAILQTTSFGYNGTSRWTLSIMGEVPLVHQRVSGVEGTATIDNYALGLVVSRTLFVSPQISLSLGLGSAGHVVVIDGEPTFGYRGSATTQTIFSSFAVNTVSIPITGQLGLSCRQFAGASFSELKVQLGDTVRARWGAFVGGASLDLVYLL
jgi:hypothetical protein